MESLFNNQENPYKKHLIRICMMRDFYTCWGNDMQDDETDKLQVDDQNRLLLFDSVQDMKFYMQSHTEQLFDKTNTQQWLQKCCLNEEVYFTCDLNKCTDFLYNPSFIRQLENRKEEGWNYIHVMDMIASYASQTDHQLLAQQSEAESLQKLYQYAKDLYFWRVKGEKLQKTQQSFKQSFYYEEFKHDLSRLLYIFKSSCLYCSVKDTAQCVN